MNSNAIPIDQLKVEFKSRYSYIHLVSSLIPGLPTNTEVKRTLNQTGTWIDTAPETELRAKADQVLAELDSLLSLVQAQLPPKKDWRQIAADHWKNCSESGFSFINGVSCGWLVERFDCSRLNISEDMPYPNRLLPLYLGQLDDASHAQIAEQRVNAEMKEILAK